MIETAIKDQLVNMDEVVTRRILAEELIAFEDRFTMKLDRKLDFRFAEFEERMDKKMYAMEERIIRNTGALIEEGRHENMVAIEALKMHIESSDRRWFEQNKRNDTFDYRINRIEVKTLID